MKKKRLLKGAAQENEGEIVGRRPTITKESTFSSSNKALENELGLYPKSILPKNEFLRDD
ncbi:MAG: hypothetical protein HOP37_10020 [Cyclobacteriaceae bacterium]|nr:hypothetical protein [Cyclobacteriaceae bacterium]